MEEVHHYELAMSGDIPQAIGTLLTEVTLDLQEINRLQEHSQDLVEEAKGLGATWAQIGDALGTTPQAAYQRWSAHGRAKHAAYQRQRNAEQ